jgi:hypothetical protein
VGIGPDLADVNRSRTAADDKTPGPTKLKEDDIWLSVNFRFQVGAEENRIHHPREKDTAFVDADVIQRAVTRGEAAATPDELRRKDVKPNHPDYGHSADPAALANSLAGRITNAAREGRTMAKIELPEYYHNLSKDQRAAIAAAIGRIAKSVAAELPAETQDVRSLQISFGKDNEYVSLR